MIYLVDIDGTLADLSHRLHFIEKEPKDWDGFFAACGGDAPIPKVINTVKSLERNNEILLVTGRTEDVRQQTEDWLLAKGISWDAMYMRQSGDHRPDNIVKGELLDQILDTYCDQDDIAGVFEDRKQVVDMYRARGLQVYQVAEGNF